mmetsp:Transcript_51641/g.116381  ORF Transcript_51641/g.116381 Transcript_51641/m.116381 type:complete len:379 (-) Transcript_51641:15-1151(-)
MCCGPVSLLTWGGIVGALWSVPVAAWSGEGHLKIGMVAKDLLGLKFQNKVTRLLGEDLLEVAGFQQKMLKEQPELEQISLHRSSQTCEETGVYGPGSSATSFRCKGSDEVRFSALCVLARLFSRYAHEALLQSFPQPIFSDFDGEVRRLERGHFKSLVRSPQEELRWLLTLVADLQQPLNLVRGDYDFGKQLNVTFRGSSHTLHSFWEGLLVSQLPAVPKESDMIDASSSLKSATDEWLNVHPVTLFVDWSEASARVACTEIYGKLAPLMNGAKDQASVEISEAVFNEWLQTAQGLIIDSGVKVAWLLKELLDHRRHELSQRHGRGLHHRSRSWKRQLLVNGLIAAVVVPSLLLGFRWHYMRGLPTWRSTAHAGRFKE